ncbi:MAG TPA: DNA integrity scanning diadenylate cyclase DisA [Chondromyces sp.]|nr:DNA integrity scanning diadenylate cyclase DisA [Chondromyces sp.]
MEENKLLPVNKSYILQLVAPGTPLREGIENVLRAKTGGLIVLGYNEKVQEVVDGGFHINCPFTPSNLYELAKMDGAIILNEKANRILYANASLAPDPSIPSSETGMRHRTAERVAKQTQSLVITISQRRNVITLFMGDFRYVLEDISAIFSKANQALQTLEKYRLVLDQAIFNLSVLEFEEFVTYNDVLQVLHRFEMVLRIKNELLTFLNELGTEGRLIRLQMNELLSDIEEEAILIIRDYAANRDVAPFDILSRFQNLVSNRVLDDMVIFKLLGYTSSTRPEESVCPRGYRALNKIPRLPLMIIENLVEKFESLPRLLKASVEELHKVDGVGEVRAKKINEGLLLVREQVFADRLL